MVWRIINISMIVLRQKEYASKLLKVIRQVKSAGNGVSVGAKNLIKGGAVRKSATQINRETIGLRNKVLDNTARTVFDTGRVVNHGVKTAIANPIAAAGQLPVGEVLMAVNPAVGAPVMATPTGAMSIMAEKAIKKASPRYKKIVEGAAERYAKSGASKRISRMPSLYGMAEKTSRFMGEMGPAFGL